MIRNSFSVVIIFLFSFSLLNCNSKPKPITVIGKGEGELSIIAWPGYIERGLTDPKFDWVTDFEKESGCKVIVRSASTSDEMVALMNEGGYDLITASGDSSLRLIESGKVREINIDLLPNWKLVDQRLQNAPWHTIDGHHFGVPFQWGPNLLLYNTKVFKTPPSSWGILFEEQLFPDGKSNRNRIQAFDGPIYIADAALYLKSVKPELGINDPYELDDKQYTVVIDLLKRQRQLIPKYWHDTLVQVEDFKAGRLVASSSWPFQVNILLRDKEPVGSTIPVEGATGWADSTMMHRNAKNINCAYKWLDQSISLKLQGDLAAWYGSIPSVPDSCKNNPLLGESGCDDNGFLNFNKISFWKTPIENCAGGRKCVPYKKWSEDFISIIGSK